MLLSRGYHQLRPRTREIAHARLANLRLVRSGRIEKTRKQQISRGRSGSSNQSGRFKSKSLISSTSGLPKPAFGVGRISKRFSVDSFNSWISSYSTEPSSTRHSKRQHIRLSWVREVFSGSGEKRPSSSVLLEIRSLISTRSLRSSLSSRNSSSTDISINSATPFPDEHNFPQRNKLVIEFCCQRRPTCIHRQAAQLISNSEPTYVFHELFSNLDVLKKERDIWNSTVLHLLAQWAKDASVMPLLIGIISECERSTINSRNIDGDTFLHILARRWCHITKSLDDIVLINFIGLLSAKGFCFDIRNFRGYNVLASFIPEDFAGFTIYTAPTIFHLRVVGILRSLLDEEYGGRFLSELFATIPLESGQNPLSSFLSAFVSVFLWSETASQTFDESEIRLVLETRERFEFYREALAMHIMPRPSLHVYLRDRTSTATISIELLDQGADPNEYNKEGQTCLMALLQRSTEPRIPEGTVTGLVQILLDHGALVNLRDQEGNTALHYAVNAELPDVVQQLIKAGVDLDARNIEGKTGSDIAINHYKMLRYLREGNSYSTTQKMMVRFFDASARRMGRVKKSLSEIPE